jgi:myo-inositol-1(or 4)-monophosphatase
MCSVFFFERIVMHTPPLIKVVSSIVEKSSKNLVRDFGEIKSIRGSKDTVHAFVQKAKMQAESRMHDLIHKTYPQANLSFKFSGLAQYSDAGDMTWVINVMDGEENFRHGLPHFCLSLALFESGRLSAALIFDPLKHDLFWAHKGMGAFWGMHRMRVHPHRKSGPIVMVPSSTTHHFENIDALPFAQQIKISWGSPALDFAYLSCGHFDGLFFQESCVCDDIYAGLFMVRESGGFASNRQGRFPTQKEDIIIAGNPHGHTLLGETLPDTFFHPHTA